MNIRVTGDTAETVRRKPRAVCLGLCAAALALCSSTALAQQASTTTRTPTNTLLTPSTTTTSTTSTTPSLLRGARTTTGNTAAAADAAADEATTADPTVTGSLRPGEDPLAEGPLDDRSDLQRMNLRDNRVDEQPLRPKPDSEQTPGIGIGTFTLRPSLSQNLATEESRSGGTRERRTFMETGLKGVLTSDWSRHALTVTGEGKWQKNLSGRGATKPSASIKSDLRLDLAGDTIANLTAGYDFSREDTDDPNAISGASQQSGIHRLSAGLAMQRDLGILRGTVAVEGDRWLYSDVRLTDGTTVSLKDRDRMAGTLRGRVGYEISPALIPFIEASIGRVAYDRAVDTAGYARSANVYGGKGGVAVDLGEKLRGEIGLGYKRQVFEDARLLDLEALSVEGSLGWSPQRGTDLSLGLATTLEPSTTPGENGYVSRALTASLSHQLRSDLVARLTGSTTWNDYSGASAGNDSTAYVTGAGLSYGLTRYIDLTADIGYEHTDRKSSADTSVLRAGIGITTKR